MDVKELLKLGSQKIRMNSALLSAFVEEYYKVFGVRPNCAGCTFKTTYADLYAKVFGVNKNNFIKHVIMENYKINVRERSNIHSFVDPKTKKVRRSYGKNMSEEFAIAFLKNGSKKEIEERKLIFDFIPQPEVKAEKPTAKKATKKTAKAKK